MYAHIKGRLFTRLFDACLNLSIDLFHDLFNSRWVNPSIVNQSLQRDLCHCTSDRVKPGQYHRFWRIIYDEIHPSRRFNGPDVATFPSDYPAFHLFVGQIDYRNSLFSHILTRKSLDSQRKDLLGLPFSHLFCVVFNLSNELCRIMFGFRFHGSYE